MLGRMPIPPDLAFVDAEELLHEVARKATGLEDFGADPYREGLRALLQSCDEDADLSPAGRLSLAGTIVVALTGRLASQA